MKNKESKERGQKGEEKEGAGKKGRKGERLGNRRGVMGKTERKIERESGELERNGE